MIFLKVMHPACYLSVLNLDPPMTIEDGIFCYSGILCDIKKTCNCNIVEFNDCADTSYVF